MAKKDTEIKEKKIKSAKAPKPQKEKRKKVEEPTPILIEEDDIPENLLPQNILPVGERVEEKKNIYISQRTYKQIHKFTTGKTLDEAGGVLVGTVIEELGKTNILVSGFIEAKYSEATPTTLTFTHETWDYIHAQMEKRYPDKKIVGWIHTHPDFGIFLSDYDKFIHENFFSEQHQIAYVIDPIQKIEGFYFWIENKLEKCSGFYIYDKTGVDITVSKDEEKEPVAEKEEKSKFSFKNVIIGILVAAVVLLSISVISMSGRIERLEKNAEEMSMRMMQAEQILGFMLYGGGQVITPDEEGEQQEPDDQNNQSNTENGGEENKVE